MGARVDGEIVGLVAKSPKRAFGAARDAAKERKKDAAAKLLDAVADACLERGDATYASRAFNAARALGVSTPTKRWLAFAEHGALDTRDVVDLAASTRNLAGLARVAVENAAHGQQPTAALVKALRARGGTVLRDVLAGWTARTKPDAIELGVWMEAEDALPALVVSDADARSYLLSVLTSRQDNRTLALLVKTGLHVGARGGEARRLGELAMRVVHARGVDEASMADLRTILEEVARGEPAPLSVVPKPEDDGAPGAASWERSLLDPAIVELALSLGVPLAMPPGDARTFTFWLYAWNNREPTAWDTFERIAAHPFFREVLAASFFPTRETTDNVGSWLAKAAQPRFARGFAPVFAALDALAAKLDAWTVGAIEVHEAWLEGVCQPDVFARCPSLGKAVRALSPERLLGNQLRAGIMDEWGWPAYEEALSRFPPERERKIAYVAGGPHPYGALLGTEEGLVVVFGPEGIVLKRKAPALKTMKDVRNVLYAKGDVLVCEYHPYQARWLVAGGKPFQADPYGFYDVACDGDVVMKHHRVLPVGSSAFEHEGRGAGWRMWFDGTSYFAHAQEIDVPAGGAGVEASFFSFDPRTGERTGHALPPWMAELVGPKGTLLVHLDATFVCPAPEGAERSPLGSKDGLGGFALYRRDGRVFIEGIDGRKRTAMVNGLLAVALMTFPARDGLYPIVQSAFDLGVAMPDGTTPLVPLDGFRGHYWAGTPPRLSLLDWLALRPRDLAASQALAACTDEAAKWILDAATAPEEEPEQVKQYGKMQAVMKAAPRHGAVSDVLAKAIARALPAVEHPRMVAGVAGLARAAVKAAPVLARLRSRVTTTAAAARKSALRNDDVGALSRLFEHERFWWVEKLGIQLGQQILDVSHFLYASDDDAMVTPAPTVVPWPALVGRIGEVLYRVLAAGTPKSKREELVTVLRLWLDTGFPSNAKRTRLVDLEIRADAPEVAGLDREHPKRLFSRGGERFFVSWSGVKDGAASLHGIQVSKAGSFAEASGITVKRAEPADARFDEAALRRVLALVEERGPLPYERAAIDALAKKTKLSHAAAALLWAAGYDPWLAGDKKIERFEIARDDLDGAEKELKKLALGPLYAKAMPDDPEKAYDAPFLTACLGDLVSAQ